MKHMMAIAILLLVSTAHLLADEPYLGDFVTVTNLWYEGHKTNVLAIAEQRLVANSNDLVGLIMKMEFNLAFSHEADMSNDIIRVLSVINTVTNGFFYSKRADIATELTAFLDYLSEEHLSAAELEEEKAKAFIIHKRMTYEDYLKWLHDDGLF